MVLVIAGFVRMRVMSLKILNVAMKRLRRRHEKHTTNVSGFIGKGVKEQSTSECCGVCLCVYGDGHGEYNQYRRENACSQGLKQVRCMQLVLLCYCIILFLYIIILCGLPCYGLALNKYKEMVDSLMWSNKQVNLKDGLKEVHISSSWFPSMHWISKRLCGSKSFRTH